MVTQTQKMGIGKEVTAMYLAVPPPDDLEQARSCESLRTYVAAAMALCPDRFRLHGRRKTRHVLPARKGSDDPLRLVPKQRTRRRPETAGPGSAAAQEGAAEALTMSGIMLVLGVFVLVAAVVDLLLGIFSIIGGKNPVKIMPAYVLSIIAIIFSIIGGKNPVKIMPAYVLSIIAIILSIVTMILDFANGVNVSTILNGIVGIVFSVTTFACARTIRKSL